MKQTNPEPSLAAKALRNAGILAWDDYDANLQGETMSGANVVDHMVMSRPRGSALTGQKEKIK